VKGHGTSSVATLIELVQDVRNQCVAVRGRTAGSGVGQVGAGGERGERLRACGALSVSAAVNQAYAPPQAGPPGMYWTISMPWPSGSITKNIRVP
jgi:hypothetical protein